MVNLSKVVEDFVRTQKSINAQLSQRIDSVESTLNKKMDGMQNDPILNLKAHQPQHSARKRKLSFSTSSKSKGIHEMEVNERESSQKREVKVVITLRSGKEVDLPTSKLEHKV